VGAATAIVAGMSKSSNPGPSYLIHTSGTGVLSWADFEEKTFGFHREHTYNDWDGIKEVTSLPDAALHRNVDKIVLAASEGAGEVKTAIVCPPCIYGPGRGPGNQDSVQVYKYSAATLKRGKGFIINEGTNIWTESHIRDLSNIFLSLVTSALEPNGGKATWNEDGYYFSETGTFAWGDIGKAITEIAHEKKLIDTNEIDTITTDDADKLLPMGSYLWGTNSRCKAQRASKLLGWKPQEKSLMDLLPEIVEGEAKKLGLIKGHAQKAVGAA
jgi:nucleoside-diphosphate-sugar epimerase